MRAPKQIATILAGVTAAMVAGCETKPVSFARDVRPILEKNCFECHLPGGGGHTASGLSMENYENLMKGTRFGSVIAPGDAASSTLVLLISGQADASIRMPHDGRKPLEKVQIEVISNWIKQGARDN